MKTYRIKECLILFGCMVMFFACGRSQKAPQVTEVTAETIDYAVFHNEITEIIQNSPKMTEVIDFLNQAGASYIFDITMPKSESERFETKSELSLALGMYAADLWYAYTFKRYDALVQAAETVDMLGAKTGILDQIPGFERIKYNEANEDSIEIVLNQNWEALHASVKEGGRIDIDVLVFVGANIEAMYILSQLTLFARDNQAMINYLSQKGDLAKGLLRLLEILAADDMVKPYYEKMLPIVAFFEANPQITSKTLPEIADLIESIRNEMIQ